MQNLTNLSELEIIKKIKYSANKHEYNQACSIILKRYTNLINKQWSTLCKQIGYPGWTNNYKDDFFSLSYEAVLKAATKVDLNKVKDNFLLVQLASWYVCNVRKELTKKILKIEPLTESIYMINNDIRSNSDDVLVVKPYVEQAFYNSTGYQDQPEYKYFKKLDENNCEISINECLKKWDSIECEVFDYLCNGKSKVEIAKLLNIPKARIYYISKKMQKDLTVEIQKRNHKYM